MGHAEEIADVRDRQLRLLTQLTPEQRLDVIKEAPFSDEEVKEHLADIQQRRLLIRTSRERGLFPRP